ncbi:MAG: Na/Pi cotransporter family protein [Dermatophilaceae bacterium]
MKRIFRRTLLPIVLVLLLFGFWLSPDFKEIAAGVALFLFGMIMLEDGFNVFSGGVLERWLERATQSLKRSLAFGVATTTIMQSSSLVSVITISFLSAGLIPLAAGVGIIFGANIGTTTGAWLVAGFGLKVDISAFALPMLAIAIVLVLQRAKVVRGSGYIIAGLGFVFLGIHHMKEGFDAFSDQLDLTQFALTGVAGLLIYTLVGALATVVMQSSHATMVLVITALAAGQLTYDNALALAIGANLGTTITAILGAATANYQGRRLALAHVIFNGVTAGVALTLIVPLRMLVAGISDLVGIAPDDYALQLAMFHTVFNVLGVLIMLPVLTPLLSFIERRVPTTEPAVSRPHYLSESVAAFPATMRAAVAKEVEHLYANATELIVHGLNLHRHRLYADGDVETYVTGAREVFDIDFDATYEQRVKVLYAEILQFVSHRSAGSLPDDTAERLYQLREAAEHIVRAVKEVKHMRGNTSRFTAVDHGAVTRIYNTLRTDLARILIELDELAKADPEERSVLWLEEERERIRHERRISRLLVEELIRMGEIDPHTATSFLNDANYGYRAMKEMLEGARLLYSEPDGAMAEVERLLTMDEDVLDMSEND